MKVDGKPYRTIWLAGDGETVEIIDQTRLPHNFVTVQLASLRDAAMAIKDMLVRGAPLIGATPLRRKGLPEDIAAAALYLASDESSFVTGQWVSPNGGLIMC